MSLLVFGQTGQVARELAALDGVTCLGRNRADLSDPAACAAVIAAQRPAAVINAAAYTAVDKAEDEEPLTTTINGAAPASMAQACADLAIPLVHISTDYVFDGAGETPMRPDDPIAPLGAYGRSKAAGEAGVRATGGCHAILRTSWVVSAHGNNFVKTMLRLGAERDRLTIVADQIGAPTPARDIARACVQIAQRLQNTPQLAGTYHYQALPLTSWADFAREIFARTGLACAVEDIPTTAYPTPAQRPLNSRLDCRATWDSFGLTEPDWHQGLDDILKELGAL